MSDNINIISIGECMVELSTNLNLSYAESFQKYYGGDTICTAVAAARLGSKVGYITRVGTDHFKDFLMDSWQAENIDIGQVKLVEGFNGVYFIARLESGEKEFAAYRRKTAATNLSINDISEAYLKTANIIYSTGITQSLSLSAREAVKKAFKLAKENNCTVAYDPNFRSRLWTPQEACEAMEEIIEYVDVVMLNASHDGEQLLDMSSPDKLIKYFWDKGVTMVAVKKGGEGCYIGYNGEIQHILSEATELVDTTGAGDAFNGGFLHGLVSGYTPFEAAKLASVVAAFQMKGIGAVKSIPTQEQVYQIYKS